MSQTATRTNLLLLACAQSNVEDIISILWCPEPEPLSRSKRRRHEAQICQQLFLNDNHNWIPVHHAVQSKSIETVEALLKYCPTKYTLKFLAAKTYEGETALFRAVSLPNIPIEIVRLLITADPSRDTVQLDNNERVTPLQVAINSGRMDIVRCLIEEGGAHVTHRDLDGETAIFYAARQVNRECIQYLLSNTGIDHSLTNCNGITAFKMFKEMEYHHSQNVDAKDDWSFFHLTVGTHCPMEVICKEYLLQAIRHKNASYLREIINLVYLDRRRNEKFVRIVERMLKTTEISADKFRRYILCLPLHEWHEENEENWKMVLDWNLRGSIWALFDVFHCNRDTFHEYISTILKLKFDLKFFRFKEYDAFFTLTQSIEESELYNFLYVLIGYGFDIQQFIQYIIRVLVKKKMRSDKLDVIKCFVPFLNCDRPYAFCQSNRHSSEFLQPFCQRFLETHSVLADCQRFNAAIESNCAGNAVATLFDLCRSAIRQVACSEFKNDRYRLERLNALPVPQTVKNKLIYKYF